MSLVLSSYELRKVLRRAYEDVKRGNYRIRDLALAALAFMTGTGVEDLLELRVDDIYPEDRVLVIRERTREGFVRKRIRVDDDLFWGIISDYLKTLSRDRVYLFDLGLVKAREILDRFIRRYVVPYRERLEVLNL